MAILSPGASETRSVFTAFRTALRELGYQEGRDVVLEFYFANGTERLAVLAQAIAARKGTDLVLADGRFAAQAMVSASRTIPIVAVTGDPVAFGFAVSLAHPGGNVTGIATLSTELGAKQLELLREIVPSARRIGGNDRGRRAPRRDWHRRWRRSAMRVATARARTSSARPHPRKPHWAMHRGHS